MNTKLSDRLHDLASQMPVDVERDAPVTLRRARARRGVGVVAIGAGVVAAVLVSVSGLRLLSPNEADRRTPLVTGPNPVETGFPGLWPETDFKALAAAQAQADDGHQPMRVTPDGTATMFATNLLGWQLADVQVERLSVSGEDALVVLSNRVFGDLVPPIDVRLRRLGDTGPNGIWSVTSVTTPLIGIEHVLQEQVEATFGSSVLLSGRVSTLFESASGLSIVFLDGPAPDGSLGSTRVEFVDERTFEVEVEVGATPSGRGVLLVSMPDATGASLGAVLVPVGTPIGEPASTVNIGDAPPDVAVTAQRIYDAILAGDVDALVPLLDPNTFAYNFDDGSNPIPGWREDPSDLDLAAAVLRLPPAPPRTIEGYGTFYLWPYLVDSDFSALTEREREDLRALGYSEDDIDLMIEGGYGYQGPRLAIDETGLWRSFTTVGE
jgi:hypothetical protein